MEPRQTILLFGDQATDVSSSIDHVIEQSKRSNSLGRFLQEANNTLRDELVHLTEAERAIFTSAASIEEMAEEYAEKEDRTGLGHNFLLCVTRLGELILFLEEHRQLLEYPGGTTHMLALCAGLLPAAAAAAANDTQELVDIGIEIVAVAFRLFLGLWRRSASIESRLGCWGYSIAGCTAEHLGRILGEFHLAECIPLHQYAYIAVESQTKVSVFGPPATLNKLFAWSHVLEEAPKVSLRVYGAAHATHLPEPDAEMILGSSPVLAVPIKPGVVILSTSTCKPFTAPRLRTLLQEMLRDIFKHPMRLDDSIQEIVSSVTGKGDVRLIVVGPTGHTPAVRKALENGGIEVQVLERPEVPLSKTCRSGPTHVAIIGASGRFPGSENVHDFWESLLRAEDFHTTVPDDRFDINFWCHKTKLSKNASSVPYGCFLDRPGAFDNRFFSISPREAMQMDPTQRLMLMASYEALEMAGYSQERSSSGPAQRITTFLGQTTDDWRDINHQEGVDIYYVPATQRSFGPGRIHHHFKWEGPTYSVDSACASSATAVSLAYSALVNRDADMALAGGGAIIASPMPLAGVGRGGFLSETGACKPFRADADGYCRGEGVGVIILKRLEDAVAAKDNIMAVIGGAARNHSALASSITHPHAGAQQRLYRQVLRQANIKPTEVGYVEMHGTGTQAGDVCEMSSVVEVFAKGRTEANPLILGAVKACVGHSEAAAGITGLIKALMVLRDGEVPPQPGLPSVPLNPAFPPLHNMNVRVADRRMQLRAPATGDGKRRLLVNNFDAAGGNTCFVLEEAPSTIQPAGKDPRTHHVVACSAHCAKSLRGNQQQLLDYLNSHPGTRLCDLAYTTAARRMHHQFRSACMAESVEDVSNFLQTELAERSEQKRADGGSKVPVGFVFTGQGAQYAGMGKQLFETSAQFRHTIRSYQDICNTHGFPSFLEIITNSDVDMTSKTTVQTQLAIVALEIGLANLWKSWGVHPDWVIGHSLGEYAALHVAEVLSISDVLYLVGQRAMAVEEKCLRGTYSMLAVSSASEDTERIIAAESLNSCEVACRNSPISTVCSGKNEDIHKLQTLLAGKHNVAKAQLLKIPFGFHSSQLDPVLEVFERNARGVQFQRPSIPVGSTLHGQIVNTGGVFSAAYLMRQAREAVNFIGALEDCKAIGLANDQAVWIEIGPSPVCLSMVGATLDVSVSNLLPTIKPRDSDWKTVSCSLAALYNFGLPIRWPKIHQEYLGALRFLSLPSYVFDPKDYWTTFAENPREIPSPTPVQLSSFIHRVEQESISNQDVSARFIAHVSEPQLLEAVRGHLIDGFPFCPSCVLWELAYAAAKHLYQKTHHGQKIPAMYIVDLEFPHPLVVSDGNNDLAIVMDASACSKNDWTTGIVFTTRTGADTHDLATCRVRFCSQAQQSQIEWNKLSFFITQRISYICASASTGQSGHFLRKRVLYRLFSNLVGYGQRFQGMEDVAVTDDLTEAVATAKLTPATGAGPFATGSSPYWMDTVIQAAGFVLNANLDGEDDNAYLLIGFESYRLSEDLVEGETYTSYVHMPKAEADGFVRGDAYVCRGGSVVGVCSGIKAQKIPRDILRYVLMQAASPSISSRRRPERSNSSHESTPSTSAAVTAPSVEGNGTDIAALVIAAVAAETGIRPDDLEPSTRFADLGVDSLMSISIIIKLQKMGVITLPAAFFCEHQTVDEIIRKFR